MIWAIVGEDPAVHTFQFGLEPGDFAISEGGRIWSWNGLSWYLLRSDDKTYLFHFHRVILQQDVDFNGELPVRVPGADAHSGATPFELRVTVETAGSGTNTIELQTSSTFGGARTTRATVSLDATQEAETSSFGSWVLSDDEYLWIRATAVGTAPRGVEAQLDVGKVRYA